MYKKYIKIVYKNFTLIYLHICFTCLVYSFTSSFVKNRNQWLVVIVFLFQTRKESSAIKQRIYSASDSRSIVAGFDDLSNAICCGADLTECLRLLHPSQKLLTKLITHIIVCIIYSCKYWKPFVEDTCVTITPLIGVKLILCI